MALRLERSHRSDAATDGPPLPSCLRPPRADKEDFSAEKLGLEFTDPLGCLVPGMPTYPINFWFQVPGK